MAASAERLLELRVGQREELTLPGLGTAGYRWTHSIEGDAGVLDVQWTRAPAEPGRAVGASVPERLLLTAAASGRVTLRLAQRRAWEAGPPHDERTLDVVVLPDAATSASRP